MLNAINNYWDEIRGTAGAIVAVTAPEIEFEQVAAHAEAGIRLIASLGGLVLLYYSIWHKRMMIKKEKEKRGRDKTNT